MNEKFDICASTGNLTPEARTDVVDAMSNALAPLIGPIRWISRVLRSSVTGETWSRQQLQLLPGEVLCAYPLERSASAGAVLVESVGDQDIWTIALPSRLVHEDFGTIVETMWWVSELSLPCVAGYEYSLGAVLRRGTPPLAEAASPHSLASHAVVPLEEELPGWLVLQERGDRALITRTGA